MRKKYSSTKITVLLSLLSFIGHSQTDVRQPIALPAPVSVFEFLKYGEVPVSEYSGNAMINIPIYSISVDGVNLPLEINYSTGGIKVSQEAGIVGLGWSLTLPSIVQIFNDEDDYSRSSRHKKLPDYVGSPIMPTQGALHPNIPNNNNLSGDPYPGTPGYVEYPLYFKSSSDFTVSNGVYVTPANYNEIYTYSYDTEPDIFTLNLNGVNLVMTTNSCNSTNYNDCLDLDIKIINGHNEYKVEKILEPNITESLIKGFKIIDPNANSYYFDVVDVIRTNTLNIGHQIMPNSGGTSPSSKIFKLSKIITHKKNEINIGYNSENFTEHSKLSQRYFRKTGNTQTTTYLNNGEEFDVIQIGFFSTHPPYFKDNNSDNAKSINSFSQSGNFNYVTSITTTNEKVSFNYSARIDLSGMQKLDRIDVNDFNNNPFKNYLFSYDYFDSDINFFGQTDIDNKRLKLISLQESGKPAYKFDYSSVKLPEKGSFSTDYWGYYNGYNNDSFIPSLSSLGYPIYSDKLSNNFQSVLLKAEAGSIKKVHYPTGGSTEFVYELHVFDNLYFTTKPTPVTTGAGLRIKQIITKSEDSGIPLITNYKYSGGKVNNKTSLTKEYTEKNIMAVLDENFGSYNVTIYSTGILEVSSANTFSSLGIQIADNSVGYDSVEIIQDEQKLGKLVKNYQNDLSVLYSPNGGKNFDPIYIHDRMKKKNGSLLEELFYDSSGNLVKKKVFSYGVITEPNYNISYNPSIHYGMRVRGHNSRLYLTGLGGSFEWLVMPNHILTFYPIFDSSTLGTGVSTIEYFKNNTSIETFNSIYFNSDNQPSSIGNGIKGGNSIETNILYVPISDSGITSDDNFLSSPYRTFSTNSGSTASFFDEYSHYKKFIIPNNAILLEKNWKCTKSSYPPYVVNDCVKTSFNSYDDRGNILEYQIEHKNPTVVIWGYNQNYPIAKIENATYAQVSGYVSNLQTLSNADNDRTIGAVGNEGALRTALSNLRTLLTNSMVTTFTYDPLIGVTSITDPMGQTEYYHYDNSNRLEFVIDKDGKVKSKNEYHYKN